MLYCLLAISEKLNEIELSFKWWTNCGLNVN
jgi:hypothetical protein